MGAAVRRPAERGWVNVGCTKPPEKADRRDTTIPMGILTVTPRGVPHDVARSGAAARGGAKHGSRTDR